MNLRGFAWVGVVVLGIAGLGLSGLVEDQRYHARSFALPRVRVDATLDPDGTLRVAERITYSFDGAFSYGTRPIPPGAYRITDLTVTEDGRPLEVVGEPTDTTFFFSARDEDATFVIRYTVLDAVPVGADVAEVFWKWVGEDHPGIDRVRARLRVPPGPGRLRAWGHGDPDGRVTVGADTVTWRADDVGAGTFVEGRVAVPVARMTAAPGDPDWVLLPDVLAEERSWAAAADARRRADAAVQRRRDRQRRLADVVAPVAVLLGLALFVVLYRRHGREPAVADVGYVRDVPDDPPAVALALLDWGRVDERAIGPTLLDLARRGHLRITEQRTVRALLPDTIDHVLERTPGSDPCLPHEALLLDRVFAAGDRTTQSEFVARARSAPGAARSWLRSFRHAVRAEFDRRRYQVGDRGPVFVANLAGALAVGIAAAFALRSGAWIAGGVAAAWAVAQAVLTLTLRRRTPAGARRAAEWLGLRSFLRDFSALEGAPAGHLVLYERFLVAAVTLGVADDLVRRLAVDVPEAVEQTRTWYVPSPGSTALVGLGTFGAAVGRSFSAAATPRSSGGGAGFGGGFSGGGGGGGGGGGIGAG